MSEIVECNLLPELWQQILQQHWTYLETDESLQKIEERQNLEKYLKDFLCLVPHSRKFLLPVTAYVLQKSILQADESSAYKASIGFESISQYANNLFTKPWRKEYRVIKMYSGFYYHEIQSNLVESEKIFEAMGYKVLPNQTLVLEGPICPDQVTNVSRDALTAFVECQILKQIFSGLTALQLSTSWIDIFTFRSMHTGTPEQLINSMVYSIQGKRHVEKSENYYNVPVTNSCNSCNGTRPYPMVPPPPPVSTYCPSSVAAATSQPQPCQLHPMSNYGFQQNLYHGMAHSKSLDHPGSEKIRQHRHYSLDQPYDYGRSPAAAAAGYYGSGRSNYDCVDGCAAASFNAYNTAGNRYPLPGGFPLAGLNQPCDPVMINGQHLAPPIVINGGATYRSCYHQTSDHPCYTEYQGCNFCGGEKPRPKVSSRSDNLIDLSDYRDTYHQPQSFETTSMSNGDYSNGDYYHHRVKMAQKVRSRPSENNLRSMKPSSSASITTSRHNNINAPLDEMSNNSDSERHKNHDGVGSFETWDYVFQNLEKQGYSKDLGERDLLVQGLDLGALNIHHDERRNATAQAPAPPPPVPQKTLKHVTKGEPVTKAIQTESVQKKSSNTRVTNHNNNNVVESLERQKENSKNRQIQDQQQQQRKVTVRHANSDTTAGLVSSGQNEWSCRFCTYLNPDSRKICEMCSKSKDFFFSLDKSTPTCV